MASHTTVNIPIQESDDNEELVTEPQEEYDAFDDQYPFSGFSQMPHMSVDSSQYEFIMNTLNDSSFNGDDLEVENNLHEYLSEASAKTSNNKPNDEMRDSQQIHVHTNHSQHNSNRFHDTNKTQSSRQSIYEEPTTPVQDKDDIISNIDSQGVFTAKYSLTDVKNYVDGLQSSPIIHKYSSALDILSSYLKGQKVLYIESRDLYKTYLNVLMIPCIFISSMCTVLSQLETKRGAAPINIYVSILNAMITFGLAFINYLKLDAAAESYRICSNQFEKLQQNVTFISGEVLLFSHPFLHESTLRRNENIWKLINPHEHHIDTQFYKSYYKVSSFEETKLIDNLKMKIKEIKHKILEAKETNQFPIPSKIQRNFPIITNINIFSTIKKLDDYQNILIIKLKNVKNKIQYLVQKRQEVLEYVMKHNSMFYENKSMENETMRVGKQEGGTKAPVDNDIEEDSLDEKSINESSRETKPKTHVHKNQNNQNCPNTQVKNDNHDNQDCVKSGTTSPVIENNMRSKRYSDSNNRHSDFISINTEHDLRKIERDLERFFQLKDYLIRKISFFKTSHTAIDNIFQQEILNNYIREKYMFRFFLIDNVLFYFCKRQYIEKYYPTEYEDPRKVNPFIYQILYDNRSID